MDVTPLPRSTFRQDVLSINTGPPTSGKQQEAAAAQRHAAWLGEIQVRATVSPDIDQLLNNERIPEWKRGPIPARYTQQGGVGAHGGGGVANGHHEDGGDGEGPSTSRQQHRGSAAGVGRVVVVRWCVCISHVVMAVVQWSWNQCICTNAYVPVHTHELHTPTTESGG